VSVTRGVEPESRGEGEQGDRAPLPSLQAVITLEGGNALTTDLVLLSTPFLIHGFWKESEPMSKQMEMVQFNKDLALAGASLAFFWAFAQDPGLTLTGPLF